MAYKQQKFVSHSSGGWRSKVKVPEDLMSDKESACWFVDGCLFATSSHSRRGEGALTKSLLRRALIPFLKAPPS